MMYLKFSLGAYCKQWKLPTSLVNFICLFRIFASCFMVYHRSIFCGLSKFYNLWCKVKFCTIMIWILKSNSKKQNHSPWTELSLKKYLDSAGSNKYKNLIIISTICRTTCKMLYSEITILSMMFKIWKKELAWLCLEGTKLALEVAQIPVLF